MKKIISTLLAVTFIIAAATLTSCNGSSEDTTKNASESVSDTSSSDTATSDTKADESTSAEQIVVPDVTMEYVPANVYVNAEAAESSGYAVAENNNISSWFCETTTFDENWNIKIPDEFSMLDGFVLRIPQGQYIMEVDVFKVADASNIDAVKALAEYRCEKQKNNNDLKLYDDDKGTNAKIRDTARVEVFGNYVVYAVTENTDVSMLRAKAFVASNPDCSAVELYRAIVSEIKD